MFEIGEGQVVRRVMTTLVLALVSLVPLAVVLFGQSSSIPYAEFSGPSFGNTKVVYLYPGSYRSIREVDFNNLTLHWFDEAGTSNATVRLKNGGRKWKEQMTVNDVGLESVEYFTPSQYALLMFYWFRPLAVLARKDLLNYSTFRITGSP